MGLGGGQQKHNKTMKQYVYTKRRISHAHFGLGFLETILSPRFCFLIGVLLANHLASTDNLTRTTKRQNTYQLKLTVQKVALISNNTMKNYTKTKTDRESRLVAFNDIWPGNGAGLLLQPQSPHGADFFTRRHTSCHPTNTVSTGTIFPASATHFTRVRVRINPLFHKWQKVDT